LSPLIKMPAATRPTRFRS